MTAYLSARPPVEGHAGLQALKNHARHESCPRSTVGSGSGFVPFMVVDNGAVQITSAVLVHTTK
jgi:hypothetical protein